MILISLRGNTMAIAAAREPRMDSPERDRISGHRSMRDA
jgi:hypothetical protein